MLRYSLAALILIAALVLLGSPGAGATELLANGGFEFGGDPWGHTDGTLETVAAPVHGGAAAGRLTGTLLPMHEVYQLLDVQEGGSYTFSGWVYLDDPGAARAFLKVRWLAWNGNPLSDAQSVPLTIHKPEYQAITTGSLNAPAGATRARFGILVEPTAPFIVHLDDFSVEGPAPGSVPTPVPTLAPTPKPTPVASAAPSPTRSPIATFTPGPTPTATPVGVPAFFSVLTNGGFEDLDSDGLPYGWRKFGGQISSVVEPRLQGSHALLFASATTSTKWVYQTVSVEPGAYYQTSVSGLKNDPASESLFLRLSWYASDDGAGSAITSVDSVEALEANAPAFRTLSTGPVQAPAGARSVRVKLMLRPVSASPAAGYFDDVRLTRVPPPAASQDTLIAGRAAGPARRSPAVQASAGATPAARAAVFTPVVPANVRARATPAPIPAAGEESGAGWLSYASVAVAVAAVGVAGFSHLRRRAERRSD